MILKLASIFTRTMTISHDVPPTFLLPRSLSLSLFPSNTLTYTYTLTYTGVQPERLVDAFNVKHCALSLVGEPIMYPRINEMLHALHDRKISTFLVTNAQVSEDNIKVFRLLNTLTRTHYYRSRHPCRFSFCSISISLPLSHSLSPSLSLSLPLPHSLSLTLSSPSRSEI